MRRFLYVLTGALLLLSLAVPTYARSDRARGKFLGLNIKAMVKAEKDHDDDDRSPAIKSEWFGLKTIRSVVAEVHPESNFFLVRNGNNLKKIDTSGAVIVIISDNGAKAGTLSDLKVGARAEAVVRKERKPQGEFQALLVVQVLISRPAPPPSTPVVHFSSTALSASEGATSVGIPVILSEESSKDVRVDYAVTGGTATGGGNDFTLNAGTLTIPAGQTSGTIALSVVNDAVSEPNETIQITLSNAQNAKLGARDELTYTIHDNDHPPVLQFSSKEMSGVESATNVSIPVMLSHAVSQDVKVDYAVTGGTAIGGGNDFTFSAGTLTIPAGQRSGTLSLIVVNDTTSEPNETLEITLFNPQNIRLGEQTKLTYTIQDNDQPVVQFSAAASSGIESVTPINIPVTLSKAVDHEVKVTYSVTGGTAVGGGVDFTLAGGQLTIPAGQTSGMLSLTVHNDAGDESDETVIVSLSEAANASLGATNAHTYTILDND